MNFMELLNGSISTLRTNKVRTLLTMLGIIIGIASVITMWAIGVGGRENILGDLKKIGYGKFQISVDYKSQKFQYRDYFTKDSIQVLKDSGKFKNISVGIEDNFRVKKDNKKNYSYADVSTPAFEKISPIEIIVGRNFLPFEYKSNEKVIVIDNLSAKSLFGTEIAAVGNYLELSKFRSKYSYKYKIVGVFKNPVETLTKIFSGENMPVSLRLPYKTYKDTFNSSLDTFDSILIEMKDGAELTKGMDEAKKILEFYKNEKDIYMTKTISEDIESFDKILSTLSLFTTLAAGISLFVGGIGVMNIMLVTVIERTKEIGIRKALGAKNRDILKQFLLESIILTIFGGIIGILIGFLISILLGKIIGIKPIFTVFSIILSMMISVIVGVIFGVSPAKKAAKLNPIDALRNE